MLTEKKTSKSIETKDKFRTKWFINEIPDLD